MSVESMAIALHHSRAKGNARIILIGIANHDGDGGAWPSLATLSKYCGGLDRKQVKRAIDKLIALKEVKEFVNGGGTRNTPDWQRPNRYTFELKCPEWCDHTPQHRDRRAPLVTFEAPGGASTPGSEHPGGASTPGSEHPGGASTPAPGVLAPPEPSRNSYTPVEKKALVPDRARVAHASPATGRPCDAEMIDDRHCLYGHIVVPEAVDA